MGILCAWAKFTDARGNVHCRRDDRGAGQEAGMLVEGPNVWHQRRAQRVHCMPGLGGRLGAEGLSPGKGTRMRQPLRCRREGHGTETSPRFHSRDHRPFDALHDAVSVVVDLERGPDGPVVEDAPYAALRIAWLFAGTVRSEGPIVSWKRRPVGFVGRAEKPQDVPFGQTSTHGCQAIAVALEGDEMDKDKCERAEGDNNGGPEKDAIVTAK